MTMQEFFANLGAQPIEVKTGLIIDPTKVEDFDPVNVGMNFGVTPETPRMTATIDTMPTFHQRFPVLAGAYKKGMTVNHTEAVYKAAAHFGFDPLDLIHQQPRGTCGGRSGAGTLDIVQCILFAAGKARFKFKRASHAALYYLARFLHGDVGGNWQNTRNDGVIGGSIPEVMAKFGVTNREETGDVKWYGQGSDDLACQLAAGMHPDLARKIIELSKDNVVTEWSPVKSAQEAADGIVSGGILIGSDSFGFGAGNSINPRDKQGFCKPAGTWHHYHLRCSVGDISGTGRDGFGYWQSWGKTVPSGPALKGHLSNCFGVDWDFQDYCIKNGRYAIIHGFPVWDLEKGLIDLPWSFA